MAAPMVKTYAFKVVVEPDENRWFAHCPALADWAAYTWGYTQEEAYKNIHEVVEMIIEGMIEDGIPVPLERAESMSEAKVTVAVPTAMAS